MFNAIKFAVDIALNRALPTLEISSKMVISWKLTGQRVWFNRYRLFKSVFADALKLHLNEKKKKPHTMSKNLQ